MLLRTIPINCDAPAFNLEYLKVCGDVHPNPGPIQSPRPTLKAVCLECHKTVRLRTAYNYM